MTQIKTLKKGRKHAKPLVPPALRQQWEHLRYERGIVITDLPVSPPTYRKVILTGICDQSVLDKLNKFFTL